MYSTPLWAPDVGSCRELEDGNVAVFPGLESYRCDPLQFEQVLLSKDSK